MTTKRKDMPVTPTDAPRRSPADIAAAVAEEQQRQRREAVRGDVAAWRALVHRCADGAEPTTEQLASIGELSLRLKAPPDSLARGVSALGRDRDLEQQLRAATERLRTIKLREPALRLELEETRQRLRTLEAEAADFGRVAATVPGFHQARAQTRAEAPLLFADVDAVVDLLLRAEAGMSTAALDPLRQRHGAWS